MLPIDYLKLNKANTNYIVTKKPFMIGPNMWWFVIKNDKDYVFDIDVTSKELFELYGEIINSIDFDDFMVKAKSGNLELEKYHFTE